MKIGFFDSGIGGLSVLHYAMQVLPQEQFVFYADEDHVPYGMKPREDVLRYVGEAFDFLVKEKQVKAIVTACNTATSVAVPTMRQRYDIPIIGMEPAAKKALDIDGKHRVLVIATPITVTGKKLELLIERVDKEHLVDRLALPQLVTFAEQLDFGSEAVRAYLQEKFAPYDFSQYSAVVLGCTHFNYFKETMRDLLPANVHFVDGNQGTVNRLIQLLQERQELEKLPQTVEVCYSGRKVDDPQELQRLQSFMQQLDRVQGI